MKSRIIWVKKGLKKTAPAGLCLSTHYPVVTFRGLRTEKTAPAGLFNIIVSTHYSEKGRASWT